MTTDDEQVCHRGRIVPRSGIHRRRSAGAVTGFDRA